MSFARPLYNKNASVVGPTGPAGGDSITYVTATFPSSSINSVLGTTTYVSGTLVLPSAGTWAISGFYRLESGSSSTGQSLNGSSFFISNGALQYDFNSSQFFLQQTNAATSLTFTHSINYVVTIPSSVTLVGEVNTGGFSTVGNIMNGEGEFYAIKLA
jgi:hypothetical protein